MPYLIASRSNPNSQQLVDDLDVSSGAAERAGYSVVRYVSDADADTLAQSGTASTIGPAPLDPVGYDPTAPQTHAAAADAVNFANAATNRTNAETNYLSTLGSQFLEARGPKNVFQFANAMIGQPHATIPAWATALKGMGELVYSPIADADRNALKLSDFTRSGKTQTSVGAGGGDAVTQQRAGGSTGGGSGGVQSSATSAAQPVGYGQTGQVWNPQTRRWEYSQQAASASGGRGYGTAAVSHGAGTTPGPIGAAQGYYGLLSPQTAAVSQVAGVVNPLGTVAPMTYPPLEGGLGRAGGSDPSDIAWKRKYHELVRQMTGGTGSAARAQANAAAGITESQAGHAIKHGQNPYAGATHAAAGYSGVARSGADLPLPPGTGWDPANASGGFSPPGVQYPGGGWPPGTAQPAAPAAAVPPANASIPAPPRTGATNPAPYPPAPTGPTEYGPTPPNGVGGLAGGEAAHPWGVGPDYHPHVGVGSNPTGGPVVGTTGGGAPTHAAAAAAGARASGRPAAIAAQQAEYQRLMTIASHWYAHQFGTDLGTAATDLQSQDPDTQAYLRAALGMARAGEIQAQLHLDDQGNPLPFTAWGQPAAAARPAVTIHPGGNEARPTVSAPYGPGPTRAANWQQAYLAQQVAGARAVHAAGGFAGALPAMPPDTAMAPPNGQPDLSALMGAGGAPPSGMPDPSMGGGMPMDTGMGGGLDPTNPQQPPEALQQIAMILQQPPAPTDGPLEQAVRENWTLGHDGQPHFVGTAAQGAQQATALAQGGSFVVTDPTAFTVNGQPFVTGEQSRDELVQAQPLGQGATQLQVVPLQRPGMAVPAWAASQANALVPGSPYHAGAPAWAQAPIHMATGGTATVYGSGSPSVLYGGSTVTNAAKPVKGNRGISETGQVRVANRGRGYSTRPTPFVYQDPNRWNPVVAAQIQANPDLLAMENSGLSSIGLSPSSTWAAFYSSLPRQNPGTATRLAGAY